MQVLDDSPDISAFRQRFHRECQGALDVLVQLQHLINALQNHQPKYDLGRAQRLFMKRNANGLYAVFVLTSYGAPFDALILLRSMFEFAVSSEYLKDHPESLALLLKYEAIEKFKWARNLVAAGVLAEEGVPDYQKMKVAHDSVASDFPNKSYWTGKNFAETVKECGNPSMRTLYELLYPKASKFVHPSPTGLGWQADKTGHDIGWYPVEFESRNTLELAIVATAVALANYNEVESLGIDAELEAINDSLRKTKVASSNSD